MVTGVVLRPLAPEDWPAVRTIFEEGIATGHATFETEAKGWEEWDASHLEAGRLVAARSGNLEREEPTLAPLRPALLGWAALSPVSSRRAYAGVAEISVYVTARARGRGVGRQLLGALVAASEAAGLWTLQAGVFPENIASLALHRACGFRVVGMRERLGRLHERWRDVVLLERRGPTP